MKIDFEGAARRHFNDALFLYQRGRKPNADHLCGFAAECALKHIMVSVDRGLISKDELKSEYKIHIEKLWKEFFAFADGRSMSALLSDLPRDNPFSDWTVVSRYFGEQHFIEKAIDRHIEATNKVMVMLERFLIDGVAL